MVEKLRSAVADETGIMSANWKHAIRSGNAVDISDSLQNTDMASVFGWPANKFRATWH